MGCFIMPAKALVAARSVFADGQSAVEKKHALAGPVVELAALVLHADIVFQFFENVPQGRRVVHAFRNRKRKSVCLIRPVIRVLSEDDDFHIFRCGQLQRTIDLIGWRVDGVPFCALPLNGGHTGIRFFDCLPVKDSLPLFRDARYSRHSRWFLSFLDVPIIPYGEGGLNQ